MSGYVPNSPATPIAAVGPASPLTMGGSRQDGGPRGWGATSSQKALDQTQQFEGDQKAVPLTTQLLSDPSSSSRLVGFGPGVPPTLGVISTPPVCKQDGPLTLQSLSARIDAEKNFWSSSLQDIHVQQMQALEVITERVDLKINKVMEKISVLSDTSEKRIAGLERRIDSLPRLGPLAAASDSLALPTEQTGPLSRLWKEIDAVKDQQITTSTEIVALRNTHNIGVAEVQLLLDEMRVDVAEALKTRLDAELSSVRRDLETLREQNGLVANVGPTDAVFDAMRDSLLRNRDEIEALERRHGGILEDVRNQQRRQQVELENLRVRDDVTQKAFSQAPRAVSSHEDSSLSVGGGCDREDVLQTQLLVRAMESQMSGDLQALWQQCNQATSMQSQVMKEFGMIKAQFIESIKALQMQHGQQSGQIEALRQELNSAVEVLRGETVQALQSHSQSRGAPEETLLELGRLDRQDRQRERVLTSLQDQHNREVAVLQSEISRQSEELSALRGNLYALQQQQSGELAALRGQQGGELELLRHEQAGVITDVMRQSEALQNQMGSVQASVAAAMQRQCEVLQSEFSSELQKLQRSDVQRSDLDAIETQLAHEVEELRRLHGGSLQRSDLEATQTQLSLEMDELRRLHGSCMQSIGSVQAEHVTSMEVLRSQNAHTKEAQTQLMSDIGSIKGQLVDNMKALQGQHSQQASKIDLDALREELRHQHAQLEDQQCRRYGEVKELVSEREGALKTELCERSLRSDDMEQSMKAFGSAVEDLQAERAVSASNRSAMKDTLNKHGAVLDNLRSQLEAAQDQCKRVGRDFHEFQNQDGGRISEVEGAVTRLEEECRVLQRHQQSGFLACFTNR